MNKILLEECTKQYDDDIDFYNEISEMLRTDITEYIEMINGITNIYRIITFIKGLQKLLRLILPEDNDTYIACKRIIEVYEHSVFDKLQFQYYLNKIKRFDVNEYI